MNLKLALGTAQFGLDYGIANKKGKVAKEEVFKILEYAHSVGIDTLDTAYSYGESEDVIGKFISNSGKSFNVISKMPDLNSDTVSPVNGYFSQTLARLRQKKIYGYLIHKFDNLVIPSPEEYYEAEGVNIDLDDFCLAMFQHESYHSFERKKKGDLNE